MKNSQRGSNHGAQNGPCSQFFARKPLHTLEKLFRKMDEYVRTDNNFWQCWQEQQKYTEIIVVFRMEGMSEVFKTQSLIGKSNSHHLKHQANL